jgi:hypothetical protein
MTVIETAVREEVERGVVRLREVTEAMAAALGRELVRATDQLAARLAEMLGVMEMQVVAMRREAEAQKTDLREATAEVTALNASLTARARRMAEAADRATAEYTEAVERVRAEAARVIGALQGRNRGGPDAQ